MFDIETCYTYKKVGDHSGITANRKHVEHLTIYTFRTEKYPYLVEVEHYPCNIYALKFYRRAHKGYKQKFNLLSNEGRCSRIVGTCFSIFIDIYRKNPLASFGFVGSHTVNTKTGEEESKAETKRFRVYKQAVINYFGEKTFAHFSDPNNSVYLAISNQNKDVAAISEKANQILDSLI